MSKDQSEKEYVSGSVKILKDHIAELSVRNLDDGWIHGRKVSLDSVMLDDFDHGDTMGLSSRLVSHHKL